MPKKETDPNAGRHNALFDYAEAMRQLIEDVVASCDIFRHIRVSSLLVGCIKARNNGGSGLYARTIPLRFEGGATTAVKRGRKVSVPVVRHGDSEALYIISFCLPRFQDLAFEDKITTVFHELYHVSPSFDGDIRRFKETRYIHTSSQKKYDDLMRRLSQEYLDHAPHPEHYEFLKLTYRELCRRHGGVKMRIFRPPRPVVVKDSAVLPITAQMQEKKDKAK